VGSVIPGRATWREPGIHLAPTLVDEWIPGSRFARPGMTAERAPPCRTEFARRQARPSILQPHPDHHHRPLRARARLVRIQDVMPQRALDPDVAVELVDQVAFER